MPGSTIDALFHATRPPRAGEEPLRPPGEAPPFQPVLEQAVAAQPQRPAPPAPGDATPSPETDADADRQAFDASEDADHSSAEVAAASADEDAEAAATEEAPDDAVEISAEAAAAATLVVVAAPPEPQAKKGAGLPSTEAAAPIADQPLPAPAAESATTETPAETSDADGGPTVGTRAAADRKPAPDGGPTTSEGPRRPAATNPPTGVQVDAEHAVDDEHRGTATGKRGGSEVQPDDVPADAAKATPRRNSDDAAAAANIRGQDRAAQQPAGSAHAPAPDAATLDALASAADPAAPAPDNASSPADAPAKPAPSDAAAAARGGDALERLTAPRGLRTAPATANSDASPPIDHNRFVSRVEGALRAAQQRDGRVQVRLSPPELGALRIELQMQHGGLTAHIEAETTAARNLLLDNLPALRDRLAQQEIRVDKFEVDVRRDGGDSTGSGAPQDRSADQPARRPHDQRPRPAPLPSAAPLPRAAVAPGASISDAGLDVRV